MCGPGLGFILTATGAAQRTRPTVTRHRWVKFSSPEFELKKVIVIALTLASLSLTAGLAVADQFVGNGGSIQGCVKNGLLEVVKAGKRCPRHSTVDANHRSELGRSADASPSVPE